MASPMTPPTKRHGLSSPQSSSRPAMPSVPDSTADEDDKGLYDESTPVMDMSGLFKKVGQTAAIVMRLAKTKLPDLERKVGESVVAAQNAQREAYDAKTAASLARERIEDVKQRVDRLEPIREDEAATKTRIAALEEDFEKNDARRSWVYGLIITIILSILASIAGAIWWASQVDASVKHEQEVRGIADEALTNRIETRPTRDEVVTRDDLKALREEIVRSREPSAGDWFNSLPTDKQKAVRRVLGDQKLLPH